MWPTTTAEEILKWISDLKEEAIHRHVMPGSRTTQTPEECGQKEVPVFIEATGLRAITELTARELQE